MAHGCDAAPVVLDRLFQFLLWVALALGIGTAGFMGYLTVRSYSPVPWMILGSLSTSSIISQDGLFCGPSTTNTGSRFPSCFLR